MPLDVERRLRQQADKSIGKKGTSRKYPKFKDAENAYVFQSLRAMEVAHRKKGGAPGKYLKKV